MSTSPISLASVLFPNAQSTKNTASAKAQATGAATSSTSSSSPLGKSETTSDFLSLLVKELQNQDPTSPVDATAFTGQIISLNSLDQLISINQTLSSATKASSTTPVKKDSVGAVANDSSAAQVAARNELLNTTQNTNAIQNATRNSLDPTKALDLSTLNFANGGK